MDSTNGCNEYNGCNGANAVYGNPGVMGSQANTSQNVGTLGMQYVGDNIPYPSTMSGTVRMREDEDLEVTNKVQRLEETAIDLNCHEFKFYRYQALRIFMKYIDAVKVGGDQAKALELFKSSLTELTVATDDNRFSKYQSAVVDEISDILNDIRSRHTS